MSNNLNLFFNRMKSHWTFSQTFLDLSRWKWRRCVAIGLLSLSVLSISANVLKSQVTLSITNATLYEAFEQLRKQYGVSIIYSNNVLNDKERVTAHTDKITLEEALNLLLAGKECAYKITENQVVLLPAEKKSPIVAVEQQNSKITGQVRDNLGDPLVGVNVMVKGAQSGTITDLDGKFTVEVPYANATLIFSPDQAVKCTQALNEGIKDSNKEKEIALICFDAEPEFLEMIPKGILIGSAMQQPYLMGQEAVIFLDNFFNNKEVIKEKKLPILPISKHNIEEKLKTIKLNVLGIKD